MKLLEKGSLVALAAVFAAVAVSYWGCGAAPVPCPEAKASPSPVAAGVAETHADYSVSISGLVRQPLRLTRLDLMSYQSVTVRLNDVREDGSFRGVFSLRGVPLRTLLEVAHIRKESSVFNRDMDLAVVVTGAGGEQAVLSWGEIYYRNPAEIVLAYDAAGLLPHKDCASCHEPETFQPWRDQVLRKVPYPKLVATRDAFSDRSIEAVTSIEVVELGVDKGFQLEKKDAPKRLRADSMKVTDAAGKTTEVSGFARLPRRTAKAIQAGDGTGFHGIREYQGVSLKAVLEGLGFGPDPAGAFVLSAPDGYRVLLSSAEIFSVPGGDGILLADTLNGTPLGDGGAFQLVPVDDHSADRWLKSVATIDSVRPDNEAELLVVGMGPGDTSLITLEAISAIAGADVLVAPEDIRKRFEKYLGGKEVLFDSLSMMKPEEREKMKALSKDEWEKAFDKVHAEDVRLIKEALDKGLTVAFLDYGDPTIYGTWRFIEESDIPKDRIRIIPGVSSVNAANGMIGRDITEAGALIVSSPQGLETNPKIAEAIAQSGETLALLVGLKNMDETAAALSKVFPADMPVAIAYKVGYRSREKLVRTTVGGFLEAVEGQDEHHLGIIYVGRNL